MVVQQTISLVTRGNSDIHDITENVAGIVESSKIHTGTAHIFVVGSTAPIGTWLHFTKRFVKCSSK